MGFVPILIAGGGPVGMTLALVLARLGVQSMLVERNLDTTQHPKMDITNVRSMELFRRLGLAQALRKVAVPQAHCFDVAWVTTMVGHELHRFRYSSVIEKRVEIARLVHFRSSARDMLQRWECDAGRDGSRPCYGILRRLTQSSTEVRLVPLGC